MPRRLAPRTTTALLCFGLTVLAPNASAEWPSTPTTNLPVCQASGDQWGPAIFPDGSGGLFLVWTDSRVLNDIYAHHVLASGVVDPGWPTNGLPISTAASHQFGPVVATDGAGGLIIAWTDFRSGSNYDVYAHHLLASGGVDPAWPVNGLAVCGASGDQRMDLGIVPDGAGGAIVVWQDQRVAATPTIYAQRVLAAGTVDPSWPVDGRPIVSDGTPRRAAAVVSDGTGGVIIAWNDARSGQVDIYAHHLLASGALDPVWPATGVGLCTDPATQSTPRLASDGAGGAIAVWSDQRVATETDPFANDVYSEHLQANGSLDPSWPAQGLAVSSVVTRGLEPRIAPDGAGGAYVAWEDRRAYSPSQINVSDVYAQHLLAAGQRDPAWPSGGRAVCLAAGPQREIALQPIAGGGLYLAWTDPRQSFPDIYAQRLTASGEVDPAWIPDGNVVCSASLEQSLPGMTTDGMGGALIAWGDDRTTRFDVYAQRIQPNGQLGGTVLGVDPGLAQTFRLEPLQPNPTFGRTFDVRFSLEQSGPVQLELLDLAGRMLARLEEPNVPAGRTVRTLTCAGPLPQGVYLMRLRAGASGRSLARRVVILGN